MTTKSPSCKQVIILINSEAVGRFLKDSSIHIININCTLKNIKSKIMANFIYVEDKGIIISTNNVVLPSNIQKIEKYVKSLLANDSDQISSPRLSQSKSYLKIVGILYINKQSNLHISPEDIKKILKNNHIFNTIDLASRPRIIKVSLKSDMAIIWINIWDTQNSFKAKSIINWHFNMGSFIATVYDANMNPGVLQCKKGWKWGHTVGVWHIQGSKCIKCNGPHQTVHHCHFTWCCKANKKTNPLRLETKKGNPCPHTFKCLNCKDDHQANSTKSAFWKHRFNKKWHTKEYAKI